MKLLGQDRPGHILTIILIAAIMAGLTALGYTLATTYESEKFSEFYILGQDGLAENYPAKLTVGERASVIAGISNFEGKELSYRLEIVMGNKNIAEVGPILLADDETWEDSVFWIPEVAGDNQKVEFFLYKGNDAVQPTLEPLHLWVDVNETSD
ncbi:MAG: DUF1616 domain-containing protein [Chloroflexi bacterium]|nr:DUF1616 domain-containing protein [Chloroflexota bacterium]